jgi:hypothetical protein
LAEVTLGTAEYYPSCPGHRDSYVEAGLGPSQVANKAEYILDIVIPSESWDPGLPPQAKTQIFRGCEPWTKVRFPLAL